MPGEKRVRAGLGGRRGSGRKAHDAYHHGALREALLEAAEGLLIESGVEGFTLRECARRAGVSHGAPAHHFGDVRGLLSELTAQSFEQLTALMLRYEENAPADAFSQLRASGVAYVAYALEHRARFQLMFRSDRLDLANERLVRAGRNAYGQLKDVVGKVDAEAGGAGKSVRDKTALAWSLVHGFSTLVLDNADFAQSVGGESKRVQEMVGRLIDLCRMAFEARESRSRRRSSRAEKGKR